MRTAELLACKVAVVLTYRVGGRDRVVRQSVILGDSAHEKGGRLPRGKLFAKICVEYCTRGIEGVKLVLHIKSLEDIVGIANGKVAGVGVIGSTAVLVGGGNNIGIELSVMLCKTVGGRLSRSCLKVVKVTVLLLIVGEALAHMVKHVLGELTCLGMGHILAQPLCIKTCLVHTNKTDGGEVVGKGAEITLGIRVKSLAKELCNNVTLDLKRSCRNIKHMVKALVEVSLVLCEICNSGHIDCNDTDRACGLTRTEEAARLFAQLTKVKTESAAHRTHVRGLHIAVNIV